MQTVYQVPRSEVPECNLRGQALLHPPLIDSPYVVSRHEVMTLNDKLVSGRKYPREVIEKSFLELGGWEHPETGDLYGYHIPLILNAAYSYGDEFDPRLYAADASLMLRGNVVYADIMLLDTPAGRQTDYLMRTEQFEMFVRGAGTVNSRQTAEAFLIVYLMGQLDKEAAMRRKPLPRQAPKPVVARPMVRRHRTRAA